MPDELAPPDGSDPDGRELDAPRPSRELLMTQQEIDAAIGFEEPRRASAPGLRAMVDAGAGPREPLPLLPVVFEDLVRRLPGSLRAVFGGEVEASLGSLAFVRYGDAIESVVLPAQVVTFRAEGWDGSGLLAMGPDFASLALDVLLGAGRGLLTGRLAARPFSVIEQSILTRLADVILREAEASFGAVTPVAFRRERVEADPRLAHLAAVGDMAFAVSLSLDLDGRSAPFTLIIPLSTLEPVRGLFGRSFAGAKQGRDPLWSGHLATELWQAPLEAEAVLHECSLPLRRVLDLAVGDTLTFDMKPDDLVEVRCGRLPITRGRMGRVEGRIAIQIAEPVATPRRLGQELAE
jgi:flagellar motor switch protein FliM